MLVFFAGDVRNMMVTIIKERIEIMLVACECIDNRTKEWCPYLPMILENMLVGHELSTCSI